MLNTTDIQPVIDRARSDDVPANWHVWRLRRDYVLRGALGWLFVGVAGILLFILVVFATVPGSFEGKQPAFILPALVLLVLGVMGVGGIVFAVRDFWRLQHADEYLLVMTPDHFIKLEPGAKMTHVPMESIAHITLRGVKIPRDQVVEIDEERRSRGNIAASGIALFQIRRQPKSPPSLAFLDKRSDIEVVVSTDAAFDTLPALEEILTIHVDSKERELRQNRSHTG